VAQDMRELGRYERIDPREEKGLEETKDEEEGLRSVGRLLLGGWPDHMAGLVREIFGRLKYVSLLVG
jgi:hypothetical protein